MFLVVIKYFQYLQQLLLLSVRNIFGHNLKKTVYIWVGQIGLIHYLVIFLCLFYNYLIVSKFNCLLHLFLLSMICSLHKWYCPSKFSVEFNFHCRYIIKFISLSWITLIPHDLFLLKLINKLYGLDEFASEIGYTIECTGDLGYDATEMFTLLSRWAFIRSSFWNGIGQISTYCCFGNFYIIESTVGYNSTFLCTCVLYFSVLYFMCCIKITSLYATDYSSICLADFWSGSKEDSFSLIWETRNDSLPCDLPVFI